MFLLKSCYKSFSQWWKLFKCRQINSIIFSSCFNTTNVSLLRTATTREDFTVDLEKYTTGVTAYISMRALFPTSTEGPVPMINPKKIEKCGLWYRSLHWVHLRICNCVLYYEYIHLISRFHPLKIPIFIRAYKSVRCVYGCTNPMGLYKFDKKNTGTRHAYLCVNGRGHAHIKHWVRIT